MITTSADFNSDFVSNRIAMGGLAAPSVEQQIKIDWDMAHALDQAGDRYAAQGKSKLAQECYARAFRRATRAHEAQKALAA